MCEEIEKMIKWFENQLNVNGIELAFGNDFSDDCSWCRGLFDIDARYLTRKVLYFDIVSKKLMTHSPCGRYWTKNPNIIKITSTDNFRWIIALVVRRINTFNPLRPCVIEFGNKTLVLNMDGIVDLVNALRS